MACEKCSSEDLSALRALSREAEKANSVLQARRLSIATFMDTLREKYDAPAGWGITEDGEWISPAKAG